MAGDGGMQLRVPARPEQLHVLRAQVRAGATAAGMRAGVPAVPVSFFGDQMFWARKIGELGIELPDWRESLKSFFQHEKHGQPD